MTVSLAALIPTRNRPALAMSALRSMLEQESGLEIFLSDNSTSGDALRLFCRDKPRVQYLRPERELSAGEHWDWAIRQVLELSTATHLSVHHDRRWFKPHPWSALAAIVAQWPDALVTYGMDSIHDLPPPLRLWQTPWSGKTFAIRTPRAAELIAEARISEAIHAMPALASCVVPRGVFVSIIDRFGDVCLSTGPDLAFMARFLALYERYLHADLPVGILYASDRSNGTGSLRGNGGDFPDFRRLHGNQPWLEAGVVPGLNVGFNMLFHEYERVRRETGDRLPPLNREACLASLGESLRWVDDAGSRVSLEELLRQLGWQGKRPEPDPPRSWRSAIREKTTLLRADRLGYQPSLLTGFTFRNDETALRYALRYPRHPQQTAEHLSALEPVEVIAP